MKSVHHKDKTLARKQIFRLLLLAAFTAASVLSAGITVRDSISLRELLFVVCSAVVLSCTAVFNSTEKSYRQRTAVFGTAFKKYVFFTGSFLAVLLVLSAVSSPAASAADEPVDASLRKFAVKIALGLRPLLYGTALHILCSMLFPASGPDTEACTEKELKKHDAAEGTAGSRASLLSRREREVARLAAQGLTNAEIAEELYISVVTVKRHLANIFEKTGIPSRRELNEIMKDC